MEHKGEIKRTEFSESLQNAVNKFSVDSYCNTNDFIISEYLVRCAEALKEAMEHDKKLRNGEDIDEINSINNIPDNECGQLLLMAISIISTESRTDQTPDTILGDIIKRRNDVYATNEQSEDSHGMD